MADEDLTLRNGVVVPGDELSYEFTRSGGPGGQHANTAATKVRLRYDLVGSRGLSEEQRARARARLAHRLTDDGVLVLEASEHRSQTRNREAVRARLAALLDDALTPERPRRPTRPSRNSRARRLADKRHRGERKRLRKPPPQT